jgi:endonuclease-3
MAGRSGGEGSTRSRRPRRRAAPRRRARPDPVKTGLRGLARRRPNLMADTLAAVRQMYGQPTWQRVHDPTSELVLTILSQNSADVNAERAFDALCDRWPPLGAGDGDRSAEHGVVNRPGWGGRGIERAAADWAAVENAEPGVLVEVIRPGGLAPQKAPRIQAALRHVRETSGGYSLDFLAERSPGEALAFFTAIPGIGRKTASVVLMFSFGMPLMPVDRHIERVAKRIGLIPKKATAEQAHDMLQAQLAADQVHEAHVNLITHGRQTCHALRPACLRCAISARCRFFSPRAV